MHRGLEHRKSDEPKTNNSKRKKKTETRHEEEEEDNSLLLLDDAVLPEGLFLLLLLSVTVVVRERRTGLPAAGGVGKEENQHLQAGEREDSLLPRQRHRFLAHSRRQQVDRSCSFGLLEPLATS